MIWVINKVKIIAVTKEEVTSKVDTVFVSTGKDVSCTNKVEVVRNSKTINTGVRDKVVVPVKVGNGAASSKEVIKSKTISKEVYSHLVYVVKEVDQGVDDKQVFRVKLVS